MRVLITGGSGFIGRHLVRALAGDEHQLCLLARTPGADAGNISFIRWDPGDPASVRPHLARFAPDACVHLAWTGIPDYSATTSRRNLDLSITLIDMLLSDTPCARFVGAGTCMEYGRTQGECVESDPIRTTSYIAWAKRATHEYLQVQARTRTLATYWLRLFYVYGPGQRADSLLPTLVRSLADGDMPNIRNPFNAQDFVYVADVAEAMRLAVTTRAEPGIYNVGSGRTATVLDMCRLVEEILDVPVRHSEALAARPVPPETTCFWANPSKTIAALNWQPRHSLADGVRQQVAAIFGERERGGEVPA